MTLDPFDARRPSRAKVASAVLGTLLAVLALCGCDTRRFVNGWSPYWSPEESTASFETDTSLHEETSPFWYRARWTPGNIDEATGTASLQPLLEAAREQGVPVLPSVTDGHGAGGMSAILGDPETRKQHVRGLVDLVMSNDYDGIDLDYETFAFGDGTASWPTTKPRWVRFVKDLGDALHRRGKLLSVTVPPIWANGTRGYTVYAWEEIAASIDRLRIMNYDWSFGSAGPGSPIWWVEDTLDYAATVAPMSKIELGIPTYGREWTVDVRGTCPAGQLPGTVSRTMQAAADVISAQGATPTRDAASGEMTFRYELTIETHVGRGASRPRDVSSSATADTIGRYAVATVGAVRLSTCVVTREVWYPDAAAVAQRARAAVEAGAGVTIWALGYETPDVWSALASVSSTVKGPAGTAPVGAVDSVRKDDDRVDVSGWAFDPEGDLPIVVRVTVTDVDDSSVSSTRLLARDRRNDVESQHAGAGQFHGFEESVDVVAKGSPSGRYDVCITAVGRYAGPDTTSLGCTRVRFP